MEEYCYGKIKIATHIMVTLYRYLHVVDRQRRIDRI